MTITLINENTAMKLFKRINESQYSDLKGTLTCELKDIKRYGELKELATLKEVLEEYCLEDGNKYIVDVNFFKWLEAKIKEVEGDV